LHSSWRMIDVRVLNISKSQPTNMKSSILTNQEIAFLAIQLTWKVAHGGVISSFSWREKKFQDANKSLESILLNKLICSNSVLKYHHFHSSKTISVLLIVWLVEITTDSDHLSVAFLAVIRMIHVIIHISVAMAPKKLWRTWWHKVWIQQLMLAITFKEFNLFRMRLLMMGKNLNPYLQM